MKCKANVRIVQMKRGEKAKFVAQVSNWEDEDYAWHRAYNPAIIEELKDTEICGGELEANIQAVDEPTWGDHTAVLSVTFKCKRCGCDVHPYLPDRHGLSLNEWLTNIVANLPE